jgi:hypothetical protein
MQARPAEECVVTKAHSDSEGGGFTFRNVSTGAEKQTVPDRLYFSNGDNLDAESAAKANADEEVLNTAAENTSLLSCCSDNSTGASLRSTRQRSVRDYSFICRPCQTECSPSTKNSVEVFFRAIACVVALGVVAFVFYWGISGLAPLFATPKALTPTPGATSFPLLLPANVELFLSTGTAVYGVEKNAYVTYEFIAQEFLIFVFIVLIVFVGFHISHASIKALLLSIIDFRSYLIAAALQEKLIATSELGGNDSDFKEDYSILKKIRKGIQKRKENADISRRMSLLHFIFAAALVIMACFSNLIRFASTSTSLRDSVHQYSTFGKFSSRFPEIDINTNASTGFYVPTNSAQLSYVPFDIRSPEIDFNNNFSEIFEVRVC